MGDEAASTSGSEQATGEATTETQAPAAGTPEAEQQAADQRDQGALEHVKTTLSGAYGEGEPEVEEKADAERGEGSEVPEEAAEKPEDDGSAEIISDKELTGLVTEALDRGFQIEDLEGLAPADLQALVARAREGENEKPEGGEEGTRSARTPAAEGAYEIKLDPEVYDEELVGELRALNEHYQGQVNELRALIVPVVERAQAAERQAYYQEFDRMLDGVGARELFGKGPGREMTEGSPELQARRELLDEIETIRAGRTSRGQKPMSEQEVFKRALRAVHGEAMEKIRGKGLQQRLGERKKQIMARPSQRMAGAETPPEEKAKEFVERWARENQ